MNKIVNLYILKIVKNRLFYYIKYNIFIIKILRLLACQKKLWIQNKIIHYIRCAKTTLCHTNMILDPIRRIVSCNTNYTITRCTVLYDILYVFGKICIRFGVAILDFNQCAIG